MQSEQTNPYHFTVIFHDSRCMGFHTGNDEGREHAERLARVLGAGARVDRIEGSFPLDIAAAAREYEDRLRAELPANVIPLFAPQDETVTLELTEGEASLMAEVLDKGPNLPAHIRQELKLLAELDELEEDDWTCDSCESGEDEAEGDAAFGRTECVDVEIEPKPKSRTPFKLIRGGRKN